MGLSDSSQSVTACPNRRLGRVVICQGAQQELGMVLHLMLTLRTRLPFHSPHGHTAQAAVPARTGITSVQASPIPCAPQEICAEMQRMLACAICHPPQLT